MNYRCFKEGCELQAQYFHKCLLSEVHCCEFHLKVLNRVLVFDSLFVEPCQNTKDAVLGFLEKENFKREEIKKSILAAISQNLDSSTEITEETLRNIDADLEEIRSWIEKISQTRKTDKKEQDSLLNLLTLYPDIALKKLREMIPASTEKHNSIKRLYWLNKLKAKTIDIWNNFNISEFEQDFNETCALYKNQNFPSDILLEEAYQKYFKAYYQTKFFFQLCCGVVAGEYIYETEEEREYLQMLDYHWKDDICEWPIVQLPNDEIFFICGAENYCHALISNSNDFFEIPSPEKFDCAYPLIYFNGSIYCTIKVNSSLEILRFDLDLKRWIYLTFAEQSGQIWNSVIFKRNIIISAKGNLLLYSIDINSFSKISYKLEDNWNMWMGEEESCSFTEHENDSSIWKTWKQNWLIKAEKRLYLIEYFEDFALIYESEIEDEYNWKIVAKSDIFHDDCPKYCLYNKRKIYFLYRREKKIFSYRVYWKFDIDKMVFIENSFYSDCFTLKQTGKKLEKIECHCRTFKIDSDSAEAYISKGWDAKLLAKTFVLVESYTQKISQNGDPKAYHLKGSYLWKLGFYQEALECFNKFFNLKPPFLGWSHCKEKGECLRKLGKSIEGIKWYGQVLKLKLNWDEDSALIEKGNIFLYDLRRIPEAIKCYDEVIERNEYWIDVFYHKGNALLYDGLKIEAIKCYDDEIYYFDRRGRWLNVRIQNAYNNKGYVLNMLGRHQEAVECYNEAIKKDPKDATFYINKGNAFNALGMNHEAIECFKEAIKLKPSCFLLFYNRGRAFNSLERDEEALKNFNIVYKIVQKTLTESNTRYSIKKMLLEWNNNPLDDSLRKSYIELLKTLVKLQEYGIKLTDEFLNLKNAVLDNLSLIDKIRMQNKNIKEEISRFITRAIEVLVSNNHEVYEEAQQNLYKLEKEASEYENLMIASISDLKSLLKDKLNTQTIENFNN